MRAVALWIAVSTTALGCVPEGGGAGDWDHGGLPGDRGPGETRPDRGPAPDAATSLDAGPPADGGGPPDLTPPDTGPGLDQGASDARPPDLSPDAGGVCTPDCAGIACGADGCGGQCGECPADAVCVQGACEGGANAPPQVVSSQVRPGPLTEGGEVTLTIQAADPDGLGDLAEASLRTPEDTPLTGMRRVDGQTFQAQLSWALLDRVRPIEFVGAGSRGVVVLVMDQQGAVTRQPVQIPLTCGGLDACAGQCTDPRTDARHCGACGVTCGVGQACQDGECRDAAPGCPAGQQRCGGQCVALDSLSHCGRCDNACRSDDPQAQPVCDAGRCGARQLGDQIEAEGQRLWPDVPPGGTVSHRVHLDRPATLSGLAVTAEVAAGAATCDEAPGAWRLWAVEPAGWRLLDTHCDGAGWFMRRRVQPGTYVFEARNQADRAQALETWFAAVPDGALPPVAAGDRPVTLHTPDDRTVDLVLDNPAAPTLLRIRAERCWATTGELELFDPDGRRADWGRFDVGCGEPLFDVRAQAVGEYRLRLRFDAPFAGVSVERVAPLGLQHPDSVNPLELEDGVPYVWPEATHRGFDPRVLPVRFFEPVRFTLGVDCPPRGDVAAHLYQIRDGDEVWVNSWNDTYRNGVLQSRCPSPTPEEIPAGDYHIEINRGSVDREGGDYTLSLLAERLPEPPPPPMGGFDGDTVIGDANVAIPALREREGEFVDLRVREPARVTLEITNGQGGCPGDSFLMLFQGGNPIAQNNDSGQGLCSRLSRVLAAGDYRIGVRSNQGNLPRSVLEVRFTAP